MRSLRMLVLTTALSACSSEGKPAGSAGLQGGSSVADGGLSAIGDAAAAPDIQRSTRSSLQWKRYATFESDLSQALELPADELCLEFGKEQCVRGVHLAPLGGNDPLTTGLLESAAEPLVTTSTVVERVVLSACLARIEQDKPLGKAGKVFATLDLNGDASAPDSDETRGVISALYRRFLARDPAADELAVLTALSRDDAGSPVKAATFAASACLAIGTTSEFLFF